MPPKRSILLTAGASLVVLANLVALAAAPPAAKPTEWAAEGEMSDACQCAVFCPCNFLDKPTLGHCDDTIALHLTHAHWGDVRLDGDSVVIVSASKEGQRMVDTVGDLVFANFYVSDKATPERQKAIVALAKAMMGADKGEGPRFSSLDKVHVVPLEVSIASDKNVVKIPGKLELETAPIASNAEGKPVTIANLPSMPPFMSENVVRRLSTYRYTDDGKDWNYGGRSAQSATFKVDSHMIEAMTEPQKSPIEPKPRDPTAHHDHP